MNWLLNVHVGQAHILFPILCLRLLPPLVSLLAPAVGGTPATALPLLLKPTKSFDRKEGAAAAAAGGGIIMELLLCGAVATALLAAEKGLLMLLLLLLC